MNMQELVYWLQGMLEYTNVAGLSEEDAKAKLQGIKDHLALVLKKVTPPPPAPPPVIPTSPTPNFPPLIPKDKKAIEDEELEKLFKEYKKTIRPDRPWEDYIPRWIPGPGERWPNSYPGYPHRNPYYDGPIC